MVSAINWFSIESILEPSAGKGDLIDGVIVAAKKYNPYRTVVPDIECVEFDSELRSVLKGKGYRVVHDDFLSYTTFRMYSLIIMNPPFSAGDKHLLKALEIQKRGGHIVCLLNAETLRNPFSNTRQDLVRKLEEYDAEVEYLEKAFIDAERKTEVDVALVKIDIPQTTGSSVILDHLKKAKDKTTNENSYEYANLAPNNIIEAVVAQYQHEAKVGCQLIQDFRALQPVISKEFKENSNEGVLKLIMNKYGDGVATETRFIREVRYKYWKTLFQSDKFAGVFTSNLRSEYIEKLDELKDYEFSYYNIYQLRIDMNKQMIQGVESAILELFEDFSHRYNYIDKGSKNIHLYNGWKTNKACRINNRVIVPLSAYDSWGGRFSPDYRVREKLNDIEKVFNYLKGDITNESDIREVLEKAGKAGQTTNIELKYFKVTFYKKGTCHITFNNDELLKKFNLLGSQSKKWLPPNYGKVRYQDLSAEESAVVDSFEGEESYEETVRNSEFYLAKASVLMITE